MSHRKTVTAPNVTFLTASEQSFIPEATISQKEPKKDISDEKLNELFELVIKDIFISLNIEKQARALSIFTQIKHNNDYINNLFRSNSHVFKYEDYEEGYEFFIEFLSKNLENKNVIVEILRSVTNNPPELSRLSQILFALNGNSKMSDEFYGFATAEASKISLFNNKKTYGFNLVKTKIDLLGYSKEYFEAATISEKLWDLLEGKKDTENISWLKYQLAKSIIELSKQVKINVDVNYLVELLEELELNAEYESSIKEGDDMILKKSLGNATMSLTNTRIFKENGNITDLNLIIKGFREFAIKNNIPPTSKTNELEIIMIYSQVGSAFIEASKLKNEVISAGHINSIVIQFFKVFEQFGIQVYNDHLNYEIEKYLNEGLRDDYKRDLIFL